MFDKHKGKKDSAIHTSEPDIAPASVPASSFSSPAAGKAAVIGPGIVINGDISGSENLVIEGKIKGHVRLGSNEVTVGKSGEVSADIDARIIRVAGRVSGDLTGSEKVIISSTGNVRGNIVAPRMLLEDGAIFKGSIDMDPGESPTASISASRAAVKPAASSDSLQDAVKKTPDLALKSG